MPREYRQIKQYEKEIIELKSQGLTQREIGERLGYPREKIEDFFRRYHRNQKKSSKYGKKKDKKKPETCKKLQA